MLKIGANQEEKSRTPQERVGRCFSVSYEFVKLRSVDVANFGNYAILRVENELADFE
jgi:hypothetical protein